MGSMNAMGHVLVATGAGTDALWDLCDEMARMVAQEEHAGIGVHSLPDGLPRYCVHPLGDHVEIRRDDLGEGLMAAAVWLARKLPEDQMWRRS